MASYDIDGTLRPWQEVARRHAWEVLLLGNGLSINVWPKFAYASLFDQAQQDGLGTSDRALFDGTHNFERALSDLKTAMRVAGALGMDAGPMLERYRSIQVALGHAIRQVHLNRSAVPDETFDRIRTTMLEHEWIFTTSYDLIVYWAMKGPDGWAPFADFLSQNGRCEFDPERTAVYAEQVPVYFLHGALHLVVGGDGVTRKLLRRGLRGLLAQFGQPIDGDAQARPLLVTEGSAGEKLRAIEGNTYLTHCLEQLRALDRPTVVFGSSLSVQDAHLVDALHESPDRPLAISMMPAPKREITARKADLIGRLRTRELLFFDARTHPLGALHLRAQARDVRSGAYPASRSRDDRAHREDRRDGDEPIRQAER